MMLMGRGRGRTPPDNILKGRQDYHVELVTRGSVLRE